jgi:hypothetical protein
MPWFVYFAGYLGVVLLSVLLQRRMWQLPMLAMLSVTFLGTLLLHLLSYAYLGIAGTQAALADSLGMITLPTVLLNMLIAIPAFGLMRDLAGWVFPSAEFA